MIDNYDTIAYPAPDAGKVKKTPVRSRNERRPLWLRALCPRPNGHVHRMVQAGKVKRQACVRGVVFQ